MLLSGAVGHSLHDVRPWALVGGGEAMLPGACPHLLPSILRIYSWLGAQASRLIVLKGGTMCDARNQPGSAARKALPTILSLFPRNTFS